MSEENNAAKCGNKKDAKNPAGSCPVKFGVIDIVPVRYAIDDMDDEEKEQKHPLLDIHKGNGFFDVAHSKYTLRQLRDGWLYVYSNKDNTFHEYQVKGTQFIKIDWGSNEADKAPEERGKAGEAKSCLSYSKNDSLTISFSHQRWTWRLCEHMRSNTQCRNEWMRTVDLKTYSNTLEIEHGGGMRDFVHAVADIGTPKPSDVLFEKTCSPLKADDPSDDEFHLATHKKPVLETDYQCDLLEKNSALYIALDDQLADITDLFLKLSETYVRIVELQGTEEDEYKAQMAELTRSLARVTFSDDQLPEHIKSDPIERLKLEIEINEYLYQEQNVQQSSASYEYHVGEGVENTSWYKALEAKKQTIKERFNFEIKKEHTSQWKSQYRNFDEIRWNELNEYLFEQYDKLSELETLNSKLVYQHKEVTDTIEQMGIDPMYFGIDNQTEVGQRYLSELFSPITVELVQSGFNVPEIKHYLEKMLDLSNPNNLLALAPFAYSKEVVDELTTYSEGEAALNMSSPSDMIALHTRLSEFDTLTSDVRIQDSDWYKLLHIDIKAVFAAFIASNKANPILQFRPSMEMLNAIQPRTNQFSALSFMTRFRVLIMENLADSSFIVSVNPNYPKELAAFNKKYDQFLLSNSKTMAAIIRKEQFAAVLVQKASEFISENMPQMLKVSQNGSMLNIKGAISKGVAESWAAYKNTKADLVSFSERKWKGAASWNGVVAALNIWNSITVFSNLLQRNQESKTTEEYKSVAAEVVYTASWTVNACALVSRDAAWSEVMKDKDLLNERRKQALKTNKKLITKFVNLTRLVAVTGLIASVSEIYYVYKRLDSSLLSKEEVLAEKLKVISLIGQAGIFTTQLISCFMNGSIGAIFAPWMVIWLSVFGIAYIAATVFINMFKRTDMELWLVQSIWGVKTAKWSPEIELVNLQNILNKPVAQIDIGIVRTYQSISDSDKQWTLTIELPDYLSDKWFGIKVIKSASKKAIKHYNFIGNKEASQSEVEVNFTKVSNDNNCYQMKIERNHSEDISNITIYLDVLANRTPHVISYSGFQGGSGDINLSINKITSFNDYSKNESLGMEIVRLNNANS
ncbi:hypothetical protein GNP61_13455 [Aliivibrio fischeri]|uniref:T6SS effector BTH_I2691 family protein n=1 Tax=Aliivibrio fischeri TaxID=668 RepID=UPI0012DAE988|nr:T6SS effector BTH_I2691 family protein [Aliivibrio fischeri]MUK42557.1 hypothetical protein [Aliivibrio fischeri]